MKAEAIKNVSQLIFQMILHSVGVSCLYFHVVLSEFMMEGILAVILLSVINVVFHSTSPLSLKKCAHQMAYVPKRMHCTVLIPHYCYIELSAIPRAPHGFDYKPYLDFSTEFDKQ